jgi:hypothetical protein
MPAYAAAETREETRACIRRLIDDASDPAQSRDRLSEIEAKVDALIERMNELERHDRDRETREAARLLGLKLPWPLGPIRLF